MKKNSIGIDLGGTRIKIGIVADGGIKAKKVIPAKVTGLRANLPDLKNGINQLLDETGLKPESLHGIGLAFPGIVDPNLKKILSTNDKYNDAVDIDLGDWVKNQWGLPFYLENDARMAGVGEWKFGAGQHKDNLVVMTIGTGIGTAAIIEGSILRGKHFQAGCLGGHFSIQSKGRLCNCGNIGCAEAYGSSWSLKEQLLDPANPEAQQLAKEGVHDFETLFEASRKNNAGARKIQQEFLDVWATTVINLIHAYDPEVVVLGGGVMNSPGDIIPYVTQKVKDHAWCPWGEVEIVPSRLLSDAGILGVAYCLENGILN